MHNFIRLHEGVGVGHRTVLFLRHDWLVRVREQGADIYETNRLHRKRVQCKGHG